MKIESVPVFSAVVGHHPDDHPDAIRHISVIFLTSASALLGDAVSVSAPPLLSL